MSNIYIDLGAYKGLYVRRFKNSKYYTSDTKIYAWECNPYLKDINYGSDVTTIRSAAWVEDGTIDFYVARVSPAFVQGSSIDKTKRTGNLDTKHPIKVPCVDFSTWLQTNFVRTDNIIVKMNIEGAEYSVLEKMVIDDSISYIKRLYVSWHYDRIDIPKERHNKLVLNLNKVPGLALVWGNGDLKHGN